MTASVLPAPLSMAPTTHKSRYNMCRQPRMQCGQVLGLTNRIEHCQLGSLHRQHLLNALHAHSDALSPSELCQTPQTSRTDWRSRRHRSGLLDDNPRAIPFTSSVAAGSTARLRVWQVAAPHRACVARPSARSPPVVPLRRACWSPRTPRSPPTPQSSARLPQSELRAGRNVRQATPHHRSVHGRRGRAGRGQWEDPRDHWHGRPTRPEQRPQRGRARRRA